MNRVEGAAVAATPECLAGHDRRWHVATIAVVGLTAILYFARLGARALWASEFRWAEIAREMLLTHNYFWPTINGHVYYDKPLGSYWLVVAATWLTGGMNEAAARLPSALAGLLAVILLIWLARDLYDLETGVIAGFILATCFSFVFFSRHADADVETVAGELTALLIFWRNRSRPPGWWLLPLWVVMALTSLMKGLLGFVLPLVVIGSYATLIDGWRGFIRDFFRGPFASRVRALAGRNHWFFNWRTPVAIAIAVVVYYWPFAISYAKTGSTNGLYMVYRENVERFFAPFDHVGPVYLYAYVIFGLMAPWSALLPAALVKAHLKGPSSAGRSQSDRFSLIFFWATFIFFTASGSRRSYYLLPILPAAAILTARLFIAPLETLPRLSRPLFMLGFAILAAAVAVSFLALIPPRLFLPKPYNLMPTAPDRPILILYLLGSAAAIAYALRRFTPLSAFFACGTVAWLFMFYLYVFAMPAGDAWRGEKPFADQVRAIIGNETDSLVFFDNGGPVYYLNLPHPAPSFAALSQLDVAVKSGRAKWVVTLQRDLGRLDFPAEVVAREPSNPWDPPDHRGNAMVLVRVKPPSLH
jgi:4-amino-4-deoxy-L-arabinose transferase-like glycosyltransferase